MKREKSHFQKYKKNTRNHSNSIKFILGIKKVPIYTLKQEKLKSFKKPAYKPSSKPPSEMNTHKKKAEGLELMAIVNGSFIVKIRLVKMKLPSAAPLIFGKRRRRSFTKLWPCRGWIDTRERGCHASLIGLIFPPVFLLNGISSQWLLHDRFIQDRNYQRNHSQRQLASRPTPEPTSQFFLMIQLLSK